MTTSGDTAPSIHDRPATTGGGRRRALRALSAALAGAIPLGAARAQSGWPAKPIRMIVGYTPGGFTDQMARMVGEPLGRALGASMLFDYKPGANSQIGVDMVAKAAPDGYTLTTVIAAHAANPSLYPKMPFDAVADFAPVALTGVAPLILVANNALPVNSIGEFVAYAKARPGQLNFGSSGKGAAAHLGMEHFMSLFGLKMQHVPYKGTPAAHADLLGGQIGLLFDNIAHVKAYWPMLGVQVAQLSLGFGVDDLDGTVKEERIYHMAGAKTPQELTRAELVQLIRDAGRVPVERDTLYRTVAEA